MGKPATAAKGPLAEEDAWMADRAAEFLGVAAKTLANWRSQGLGPSFIRYGSGRVAYLPADLSAYREKHRVKI